MKSFRLPLLGRYALALAIASAASYLTLHPSPGHEHARQHPHEHEEDAVEIDQARRDAWDLMRLRDPATGEIPEGIRRKELAFAATIPGSPGRSLFSKEASADDHVWSPRGPYNVGGRTRALGCDVDNAQTLIAGGATGGIWRTVDGGGSWLRMTPRGQFPSVTCLAQDTRPGRHDVWYYGTGEFRTNSTRFGNTLYGGDGIFKSTDDGVTWSQLGSTVVGKPQQPDQSFSFVNTIAIDTTNHDQDEVYAAVLGGIMRSTDGGTSWKMVLGNGRSPVGYTDVRVASNGVVYAAIGTGAAVHGIWRSADGINWTNITPSTFGDSVKRTVIGIAPSNPDVFYLLAETEGSGKQIPGSYGFPEYYSFWKYTYGSGDGSGSGGSWEDRSSHLPYVSEPFWVYNGLMSYAMLVAVKPTDENTVYIGGSNLWVSMDGFASDNRAYWLGGYEENGSWGGPEELHPDEHAVVFSPNNPNLLYVGNDGGIFRSSVTDEPPVASWTSLDNGYVTTQFYSVALDHSTPGSDLVIGGAQDNGSFRTATTDARTDWQMLYGGDGSFCAIAGGGNQIYVSSQFGNIIYLQLDNDGNFVDYHPLDLGDVNMSLLFVTPFAMDPNDNTVLYAGGGPSIMLNQAADQPDAGNTWITLDATTIANGQISAVGVSTSAPEHRIYYGTTDGHLYLLDDANTGSSQPREITGSEFPAGGYINCVAVDPQDAKKAVVVFSNYNVQSLFMTTDAGATWTPIGGNLEQFPSGAGNGPSCRWASFLHRGDRTILFVGATTGLYSTERFDGTATTWTQEGAGTIGSVIVDMIDTRQSDGTVLAATWANGIYSTVISGITGVPLEATADHGMLRGASPNPCRDGARIDFDLPADASSDDVDLAIFDETGRRVTTLVEGHLDPGPHSVRFDPRHCAGGPVPSGMYYYRLRVGSRVDTRGLVVG